jgi:hypothetical protein
VCACLLAAPLATTDPHPSAPLQAAASHPGIGDSEDGAVALLRRSFRQFQLTRSTPQLQQRVEQLKEQRDAVQVGARCCLRGWLCTVT